MEKHFKLEIPYRLEILHYILQTIKNDGAPADTIYGIKIPLHIIHEYVGELKHNGFIVGILNGGNEILKLTDKGLKYVENYSVITNFTTAFGL